MRGGIIPTSPVVVVVTVHVLLEPKTGRRIDCMSTDVEKFHFMLCLLHVSPVTGAACMCVLITFTYSLYSFFIHIYANVFAYFILYIRQDVAVGAFFVVACRHNVDLSIEPLIEQASVPPLRRRGPRFWV